MLGTRMKARQNLMVSAINVALQRKLFALTCDPAVQCKYEYELAGIPIIAHIRDAGFDEVRVAIIASPTMVGERAVGAWLGRWKKYGDAWAHGWLERRMGKYIQSGYTYHGTKKVTAGLAALTIEPDGFDTKTPKRGYDYIKEWEATFGRGAR